MAMQTLDDLSSMALTARAAASLAPEQRQVAVELHGAPPGIVGVATGLKLSQWRYLASGWSDADREAMETFIEQRVRPWLEDHLAEARRRQAALLADRSMAGMLAHMWKADCHPLQEESGPSPADPPPTDTAARLAALFRAAGVLKSGPDDIHVEPTVLMRLDGYVAMCREALAIPPLPEVASLDEWIAAIRSADSLGDLPPRDRRWFAEQTVTECDHLWMGAGEALRGSERRVLDILEWSGVENKEV